jgi:RNA polymerase sigma-70 factor (ECF subfamily)
LAGLLWGRTARCPRPRAGPLSVPRTTGSAPVPRNVEEQPNQDPALRCSGGVWETGVRQPASSGEPEGAGDPFELWVAPHVAGMRRTAAPLSSEAAAEDVAQEALVRAWRKRDLYVPDRGTPKRWLNAITREEARRWRIREQATSRHAMAPMDVSAGASTVERDLDLRNAITSLPPRQREAIFRFYYLDQSVRQLAAAMRCSVGTVKSTLADGRRSLLATRRWRTTMRSPRRR